MAPSDRDRFLIALAKFLGVNPSEPNPISNVLVCQDWLANEVVADILPAENDFRLDLESFNRLMLHCGRGLCTPHFYEYFFQDVNTLVEFENAVEKYRIKAMWLFGNFRFGYKQIATSSAGSFRLLMEETEPISADFYIRRKPFTDIEQIPVNDLSLLGYISSAEVTELDLSKKLIETLLVDTTKTQEVLKNLGNVRQEKMAALLRKHGIEFPSSGVAGLFREDLERKLNQISEVYRPLKKRQEGAIAIGKRNTHRYLTLPFIDVYFATSMRNNEDFIAQNGFVTEVFNDPQIAPLKLRYFDPTLSYVDDRISKGLIEMLMLQRAAVTVYSAAAEDTLGKDSELAATLAQGKAVIVYVPSNPRIVELPDGRKVDMDRRAKSFQIDHPLGLQINVRTGVAHGVLVVRTPQQCAQMLRKIMLRERTFRILHRGGNFLLEETETKSVLRVVSDDPFLTHAFWTYFKHHSPDVD